MKNRIFPMAGFAGLFLLAQVSAGLAALGSPGKPAQPEIAPPHTAAAIPAPRVRPPAQDDKYLALVEAAIASPETAKWCEIRDLYPGTSFYRGLGDTSLRGKTQAVGKKVIMEGTHESVKAFKIHLFEHFGNLDAHRYAAYLHRWNEDLTSQGMTGILPAFGGRVDYIDPKLARRGARELMKCLATTGDGKSMETAFRAAHADEMFIMIEQYYHVDATDGRTEEKNGNYYTAVSVSIPDTQQKADIWFRLDPRMVDSIIEARAKGTAPPAFPPGAQP